MGVVALVVAAFVLLLLVIMVQKLLKVCSPNEACPRNLDSKTRQLLQHRAQLQRSNPSWPEQLLWQALRSGQLGVPFRRQVPLGPYIVDFVAPRAKLVVEVDGLCHQRRRGSDARRDRKLARMGYRVLRVEAQLVLKQLPVALARVRQALAEAG